MNYLQKKKLAFMSIVNSVKGFIRTITGVLPLTLEGCVDEESIIDYTIYGESVQNGTPTPETPIEVESVGERTANLWGNKTAIAKEGVNLTYEWDEKGGVYFHNISTATKQCDVYLTLPAGTYTFQTSRKVYFYKDGGNSIGYTTFNTISSTEEFVLTLRFFVSANASDYLQAMVVEGEYTENTMPPYEPYGYKIPIKVSGKNLFDISSVNKMYNSSGGDISAKLTIEDGVLRNKYGAYAGSAYIPCNITTLSAGTYTLSCEVSGATTGYIGMYINKVDRRTVFKNPNGVDWGKISYKFTLEEESTITGIQLQGFGDASNYLQLEIYFRNIQIEESDTATDYEPYHEPITTNIYLDEPLRKVGDYADYIKSVDLVNGTGTVARNVKKKQLTKASKVYVWVNKKGVVFADALDSNYTHNKALCNRNGRYTNGGSETITMWVGISNQVIYWLGILDYLGFTTLEEMNEWLTNNPTYVFYGTDLPTETPITLPPIPTFKGTSIISADTTVQPSNAEIEYYSNVKE